MWESGINRIKKKEKRKEGREKGREERILKER